MRIISDFKDYYDVGMATCQESEPLYIRNETEEKFTDDFPKLLLPGTNNFQRIVVSFCGKLYPAIESDDGKWYYEFNAFNESLKGLLSPVKLKEYVNSRRAWKSAQTICRQYFQEQRFLQPGLCIPVAVYTFGWDAKLTKNGSLRDYEFYRLFPPYQAYQAIRMFLSNQANPQKPIPKITDEILAEAKGFDKYSFRKIKETK